MVTLCLFTELKTVHNILPVVDLYNPIQRAVSAVSSFYMPEGTALASAWCIINVCVCVCLLYTSSAGMCTSVLCIDAYGDSPQYNVETTVYMSSRVLNCIAVHTAHHCDLRVLS